MRDQKELNGASAPVRQLQPRLQVELNVYSSLSLMPLTVWGMLRWKFVGFCLSCPSHLSRRSPLYSPSRPPPNFLLEPELSA